MVTALVSKQTESLIIRIRSYRGLIRSLVVVYVYKTNVYRILVGKPEGKRSLGRPRRRWIDNIKMDLLEI
jgi:hypothetical protein